MSCRGQTAVEGRAKVKREVGPMNGMHTLFDTRRKRREDSLLEMATREEEMSEAGGAAAKRVGSAGHASSFLAERGELETATQRVKRNP